MLLRLRLGKENRLVGWHRSDPSLVLGRSSNLYVACPGSGLVTLHKKEAEIGDTDLKKHN